MLKCMLLMMMIRIWLSELEKGWINANELMYKDNKTEFSEFRELKPFVGAASAKNWNYYC